MLETDFFVPEVEFVLAPEAPQKRKAEAPRPLLFLMSAWGFAAVTMLPMRSTGVSELRVVPSAIFRSHPSPELSPEIIALYRDSASEDSELAEFGIADYGVLIADADET